MHSDKLQELFNKYEYEKLHMFLSDIFGVTYVKTYSDCGLYVWLGATRLEFDNNWKLDYNAPSVHIKTKHDIGQAIGENIYIFLNHTEEQVINKFNKYQKLRAFL